MHTEETSSKSTPYAENSCSRSFVLRELLFWDSAKLGLYPELAQLGNQPGRFTFFPWIFKTLNFSRKLPD